MFASFICEIKESLNYVFHLSTKPKAIICHTIKGKGFLFAENNPNWHHKSNLSQEDIDKMYESIV